MRLIFTLLLLVNEDTGLNKYAKDGGAWTLNASLEPNEAESGLGDAIAVHGDQDALLATGSNYELGAVVFADADLNRTGRLAMVPEVSLASSGPADCNDGQADQFGCSNVDMLSFVSIRDLGGGADAEVNDLWGWTDPESGKEYALVSRNDGTAFVDITNPAMPVFVGDLPLTEGARPSNWRDIKVYNDHAFIVSDGAGPHGMQVFDLRTLRDVQEMPADFSPLTVYDEVGSAHNIVINEASGYAYDVKLLHDIMIMSCSRTRCAYDDHRMDMEAVDEAIEATSSAADTVYLAGGIVCFEAMG